MDKVIKNCLICSSKDLRTKFKTQQGLKILECSHCRSGLLAVNPEADNSHLYTYYNKRLGKSREELYNELTSQRCRDLLSNFSKKLSGQDLLDVGCGQGQFIDVATHQGWNAFGIDSAPGAVEISQSFGLSVEKVDFFSADLDKKEFDLITMFEFIEHVANPSDFIQRACELLKPGGILHMTTPNYASLDRYILKEAWSIFRDEHLIYFTSKSLRGLVEASTKLESLHSETVNLSMDSIRALMGRTHHSSGNPISSSSTIEEEALRNQLESKSHLKWAKGSLNQILNIFKLGNALKQSYRKPAGPRT